MLTRYALGLAPLLLVAGLAAAQEPTSAAAAADPAATAASDQDRMVCRNEQVTGSRLPHRV
jgi:hypothetical protein